MWLGDKRRKQQKKNTKIYINFYWTQFCESTILFCHWLSVNESLSHRHMIVRDFQMAVCDNFFLILLVAAAALFALSQVRQQYSNDLAKKICHISSFNCLFFDLYCFTFWFSSEKEKNCWTMIYNLFLVSSFSFDSLRWIWKWNNFFLEQTSMNHIFRSTVNNSHFTANIEHLTVFVLVKSNIFKGFGSNILEYDISEQTSKHFHHYNARVKCTI